MDSELCGAIHVCFSNCIKPLLDTSVNVRGHTRILSKLQGAIIKCFLDCIEPYNTTLLPSVNTIALGMFCGARYTHHTFTPIIKHQ